MMTAVLVAFSATSCEEDKKPEVPGEQDGTITFAKTNLSVTEGETVATVLYDELANEITSGVTYTTDKATVATVDAAGVVTGVAAGEATITATMGEATATCKVTVTAAAVLDNTLTQAAGILLGSPEDDGIAHSIVFLGSDNIDMDNATGAGTFVSLYLCHNELAEAVLPTGTWNVEAYSGSFADGVAVGGVDGPNGTFIVTSTDGMEVNIGLINEGTITITKNGDNYTITAVVTPDGGEEQTLSYTGAVQINDVRPVDLDLTFTAAQVVYGNGDPFGVGKDIIIVAAVTADNAYAIQTYNFVPTGTTDFVHTYVNKTQQEIVDWCWTTGGMGDSGPVPSYVLSTPNAEGQFTEVSFLEGGTMEITATTIEFDMTMDNGAAFTATANTYELVDNADAAAPMLKAKRMNFRIADVPAPVLYRLF